MLVQLPPISDQDFAQVREMALRMSGINLGPAKRALVEGRLRKRVLACGLAGYGEYLQRIAKPEHADEKQMAMDLLTTNETSFFREPRHFEYLRKQATGQGRGASFRVWSAACSSGEEVYTIAMVLADALGNGSWEVRGSDLSTRVLETARRGHYPLERSASIPAELLKKYCLQGRGAQSGTILMDPGLRSHVQFWHGNLLQPAPASEGMFDAIFLRNVMIYFDAPTKQRVVRNLLPALRPGGLLYIGHSESLHGLVEEIESVASAIYRKVAP